MTGANTDEPKAGKTPSSPLREARLAEALRANLRRRKAPADPGVPGLASRSRTASKTGDCD